jgi:hypothetical protein
MARYKPHNYDYSDPETSERCRNGSTLRDFFFYEEDENHTETEEEKAERIRKENTFCKFGMIFICIVVVLMFVSAFFLRKNNEYNFENNWTVVEGTEEKATVIASQLEMTKGGRYRHYIAYLTIKTSDGKTGTFASEEYDMESDCKPIAGLNVGDSCMICMKRYSGEMCQFHWLEIEDGDTAWFINDEIVFYQSEEEMAGKYLKDF